MPAIQHKPTADKQICQQPEGNQKGCLWPTAYEALAAH